MLLLPADTAPVPSYFDEFSALLGLYFPSPLSAPAPLFCSGDLLEDLSIFIFY
jgi:hypothetical protein